MKLPVVNRSFFLFFFCPFPLFCSPVAPDEETIIQLVGIEHSTDSSGTNNSSTSYCMVAEIDDLCVTRKAPCALEKAVRTD